jgi:hypothetical protein
MQGISAQIHCLSCISIMVSKSWLELQGHKSKDGISKKFFA